MNAKTADIKRIVAFAMKQAQEGGAVRSQKKYKGGKPNEERRIKRKIAAFPFGTIRG